MSKDYLGVHNVKIAFDYELDGYSYDGKQYVTNYKDWNMLDHNSAEKRIAIEWLKEKLNELT